MQSIYIKDVFENNNNINIKNIINLKNIKKIKNKYLYIPYIGLLNKN